MESTIAKRQIHLKQYTEYHTNYNEKGNMSINTFTAIVDHSRSNFSIARAPLFQLKSAT